MVFQTPSFLHASNLYEVNIRQYTKEGTFNAFAKHLPRLKDMGVEILWLMPIHPIGKVKRKGSLGSYYSISDHRAINPEFGTAEDFRNLISKVHAVGMKIIIDWVANHAAWDHIWTVTNPEYFTRDVSGNFLPPYDWDDVIQIDHSNSAQQSSMMNAMKYWITDFDIDGFRADLAHLTPLRFWKNARLLLTPFKKDLIWLGETEQPEYHEAFDITYTWEWMHATERFSRGEIALKDCLNILRSNLSRFPADAPRMYFTSNHDENSWNGTEYEKYGIYAKAWAIFSCLYPGVPLIYSGQEVPNLKRLRFFDKDELQWPAVPSLQEFYKALLECRKSLYDSPPGPVLILDNAENDAVLGFLVQEKLPLAVFLNMGPGSIPVIFRSELLHGSFRNIFSNELLELNGQFKFNAPSGGYVVLQSYEPEVVS